MKPRSIPSTKLRSPWNYKPWWCQPWSIVVTGFTLIATSWIAFHRIWITGLVAIPVLLWMGFFLLLWPRLVMTSGDLDTLETSPENLENKPVEGEPE